MAWAHRWLGLSVIGLIGWLASGCATMPDWALPKSSFSEDIRPESEMRVARAQSSDPSLPRPPAQGIGLPVIGMPTPLPPPPSPTSNLPSPPSDITLASLKSRGMGRVSIRAWVNGKVIFDDELEQVAGSDLRRIAGLPEPARSEKAAEIINTSLDHIIDAEVMYQEAMKRIEKGAPHMIAKLKQAVDEEYYKQADKMRKTGVPDDYIKKIEPTAKRMLERNLISSEYARSAIVDRLKINFNFQDIKDYFDAHANEFRSVDKVIWQDIFIPIGPNLPKIADAQRFAEELLAKCRTAEDFNRLMVYNEGDSKLRNGEGLGQRKGEIRPQELEAILFSLSEGAIGPVVPFHTGVHLVRVVKREFAGQMPLDHSTQMAIKKKLENQFFDREYKRVVRELRSRAVISIQSGAPGW